MRKSLLVIFLVAAAVFAMGVSSGQAGTITAVEKFVTLTKPLCLDTRQNFDDGVVGPLPGFGWAVYPYQDQYGLNIRIPLTDFAFLAENVPTTNLVDDLGDPIFVPFNASGEFTAPVTITVSVDRGTVDGFEDVLKFTATMGVKRQATVKNQFQYLNSFALFDTDDTTVTPPLRNDVTPASILQDNVTLIKRNQIVDNFHVNFNKSALLLTLSGLRYHNFGENLNLYGSGFPGPYNDLEGLTFLLKDGKTVAKQTSMETIFDMDTFRTIGAPGTTPITADSLNIQNVRVLVETSYTASAKAPVVPLATVKHAYLFSTAIDDDLDELGAKDLLLTGSSAMTSRTVTGCDGIPINQESERLTGTAPLVPIVPLDNTGF